LTPGTDGEQILCQAGIPRSAELYK